MATGVMVGMFDRPWSDNNFALFFVVALAMAGGVEGSVKHISCDIERYIYLTLAL